jgi:undecaprenyl-diphosphatase
MASGFEPSAAHARAARSHRDRALPKNPDRTLLYFGLGLAAALLGAFWFIADEVIEGDTLALDTAILMTMREPGNPTAPIGPAWFLDAVRDVTALGSITVLGLLVFGIALQLLLAGARRTARFVLLAVAGGTVLSSGLKALFDRPRPEFTQAVHVFSASFPSGHATVSAVVYLTLGVILAEQAKTRTLRVFYVTGALFLTVLVGLSRLYLGVHYPTDVVAGWALGAAWALCCLALALWLRLGRTPAEA